jgi:hypothetical protein
VKQRLPLILSACALAIALLGATPLGNAAQNALAEVVPFAKKAEYANTAGVAQNAKLLNGFRASRRPRVGTIPVLGPGAKLAKAIGAVGPTGPTGPVGPAGAAGPAGAQGEKGPTGDPATRLFAHVDDDGSLLAGSGIAQITHPSAGIYHVKFTRALDDCAVVVGSEDGYYHTGGYPHGDTVDIQVRAPSNAFTSIPFALAAFC